MVVVALAYLVPAIAALAAAPILAHALGVAGRGQTAAATAPLLLATVAGTLGVPDAVTFFVARHPSLAWVIVRRAEWLVSIAALGSTALIIGLAPVLSGGDHHVARLIVVASVALAPSLLTAVLRGAAGGRHEWNLVSAEQVVSALARLAALALLAAAGRLGVTAATVITAFTPVAGAAVYAPMLRRLRASAGPGTNAPDIALTHLLGFGSRVWVGSLSGVVLARLDQAVMAPLSDAYQLGLYAVAVNVSEVVLIVTNAVRDVTVAADAADPDAARLAASARIAGAASLALAVGLGGSLSWWLPIVFGSSFRPATDATWILLAAVVAIAPGSVAGAGLTARGRPELRSASLVLAAAVNAGALWLLVPRFGATGGAWATLLGNATFGAANLAFLRHVSGVSPRRFVGLRASDVELISGLTGRQRGAVCGVAEPLEVEEVRRAVEAQR